MRSYLILLFCLMFTGVGFGENPGFLNVITGRPSASIFIDGEFVANDYVKKHELMEGQHYVRVEYNNQLMYAKMVSIQPNKLVSITTENFVDIRTNTASRGAVNREASRLRDTKGDFGLGVQWGETFPAKGMSLKWLSPINIGVQFSAIGKTKVDNDEISEIGLRAIIPIGNKIFSSTNFSGFTTLGVVSQTKNNNQGTLLGGSVGIEFGFADPVYFTAELGVANGISGDVEDGVLMSWAVGMHFYF
ncbi:MAG: hypothetical protein ISQ13_00245 [Candidatus Margulisbacteria bacterium]|nr:hypothetical protein [Candidatus Margulisiibacteriota bacterium]